MPLFGKSHKSPADIVRTLKENLAILVKHDKKTEKVEKESACVGVCVCSVNGLDSKVSEDEKARLFPVLISQRDVNPGSLDTKRAHTHNFPFFSFQHDDTMAVMCV